MLLDRGLLDPRERRATAPTGTVEALDVPETLHALIAARLDGLDPERAAAARRTPPCSARRSRSAGSRRSPDYDEAELEPLLASLVRKEVLVLEADPRSPERGQYGFLQDLLQRVAYETLAQEASARRATLPPLRTSQAMAADEEEIVEVIAAHYLDAYQAAPDADDAPEIKARALRGSRAPASAPRPWRRTRRPSATSSRRPSSPTSRWRGGAARARRRGCALGMGATTRQPSTSSTALELFEAQATTHQPPGSSAELGEVAGSRRAGSMRRLRVG